MNNGMIMDIIDSNGIMDSNVGKPISSTSHDCENISPIKIKNVSPHGMRNPSPSPRLGMRTPPEGRMFFGIWGRGAKAKHLPGVDASQARRKIRDPWFLLEPDIRPMLTSEKSTIPNHVLIWNSVDMFSNVFHPKKRMWIRWISACTYGQNLLPLLPIGHRDKRYPTIRET